MATVPSSITQIVNLDMVQSPMSAGRQLPEIMNEDYDEFVRLVSPDGAVIVIFSIRTKALSTCSE